MRRRLGSRGAGGRGRRRCRAGRRSRRRWPGPRTRRSKSPARSRDLRRPSSRAALVATRYAQVENFARPSNEPILRAIASNASCVASSASSGLPRTRRHTPCTSVVWRRRSSFSASLSPAAACFARVSSSSSSRTDAAHSGRSIQTIPMTRGPVCTPITAPIVPTVTSASGTSGSSIATNSSTSGALACSTPMVSTLPDGIAALSSVCAPGRRTRPRRRRR
jgi:hypothetical protein